MSYAIVKSCNSVKGPDGLWHLSGCWCMNNDYPRTPYKFTDPQGYADRAECDGEIIRNFFEGNMAKGSKYATFVDEIALGVYTSRAACRFLKLRELNREASDRYYKDRNGPGKKWLKVEQRLNKWLDELYMKLAREFRTAWKPNTERFKITLLNGSHLLMSIGRDDSLMRYRYAPVCAYWEERAPTFSKTRALRFCRDYAGKNPQMVKVA